MGEAREQTFLLARDSDMRLRNADAPVRASMALLVALVLSGPARALPQDAGRATAYSFGVFPFLPAARLEAVFAPIAGDLGRAVHRDISYRSAATYEQFSARLARQEFDIAHIQPFDYVRTAAGSGYLPIARRNAILAAIAVVPDESPIRTLRDLRGATVVMPPEVAATSYLGWLALMRAGLDPRKDLTVRYVEDHHSCIHQVLIGNGAACFTGIQSARLFESRTGRKLRVVGRSPAIPQTLFVVHSRVPADDREIIRRTLLDTKLAGLAPELVEFLSEDARGPFIPARDADYDVVREYWQQVRVER
jgi:phosphonate transport system substrate-binding protein